MPFKPRHFFEGVRYIGRAKASRVTYHVYGTGKRYLLLWPSSRSANSYYMSEVPKSYVERVAKRFAGKRTTSVEVKRRLGGPAFRPLSALVALVAQGRAKVAKRSGRTLVFHVRKS